ncbi:hypothetical protein ACHQM5_028436 [Ranunculus cassubicifolius]
MAMIKAPVNGVSFLTVRSSSSDHVTFLRYPPLNLKSQFSQPAANRQRTFICKGYGGGAQMNLFGRFARVVKSYANAFISFFEEPDKIIEQAILDMDKDLANMRLAASQVLASQKHLEKKYEAANRASEDWHQRAQLALRKGDESLAREALKRRKSYTDAAGSLRIQLDQQKPIVDNLLSNTQLLASKIQEAKAKKETLKARAQTAKTARKVNGMLANVDTSSALSAFDRMEEKVLAMETESDALSQLTDTLEGKFALLESPSIEDELADLKTNYLETKSKGAFPYVRIDFQDIGIEKELDEIKRKEKDKGIYEMS